jgi:mono/diheme cytochrome c family protein
MYLGMNCRSTRFLTGALFCCSLALNIAQATDAGKAQYIMSCASCHGENGKGDGPAAQARRAPPPDLTLLAKRNEGAFPNEVVSRIVDGSRTLRAHGNYEMPVWGRSFTRKQVAAMIEYLKTIQVK